MLIRDPALISKVAMWRQKAADGTISIEEMREAVLQIRQGRVSSAESSRASRSKTKTTQSADEMLREIEGL